MNWILEGHNVRFASKKLILKEIILINEKATNVHAMANRLQKINAQVLYFLGFK